MRAGRRDLDDLSPRRRAAILVAHQRKLWVHGSLKDRARVVSGIISWGRKIRSLSFYVAPVRGSKTYPAAYPQLAQWAIDMSLALRALILLLFAMSQPSSYSLFFTRLSISVFMSIDIYMIGNGVPCVVDAGEEQHQHRCSSTKQRAAKLAQNRACRGDQKSIAN